MASALEKYFEVDEKDNCVRFLGDTLQIYIPEQYVNDKKAFIRNNVQVLACLDLVVNGTIKGGIHLPAFIEFNPIEIYKENKLGRAHIVCVIHKGGKFINNLDVMQDQGVPYYIFMNMITYGRMPEYITYDTSSNLFDDCKEMTGKGVPVDQVLWEIIMAYLHRDNDNKMVQYRHTNMLKKPWFSKLKNVSYSMNSTHTRVFGSYSNEGLNSSLLNPTEESHEIENLFRQ